MSSSSSADMNLDAAGMKYFMAKASSMSSSSSNPEGLSAPEPKQQNLEAGKLDKIIGHPQV